jgi:hypothetical protein
MVSMRKRLLIFIGAALWLTAMRPEPAISITRNEAVPDYPERIDFHLTATSSAEITHAYLSYGTDAQTCGEGLTRAIPEEFVPSNSIEVEWTWNLRQAGPLPPGTTVYWQWDLRDASGAQLTTPRQSIVFTNPEIEWLQTSSDSLDLYWTEGSSSFADSLLEAGEQALSQLREMTGVEPGGRIRIYVYPSSEQMQANTLFAPDWSGGLAFASHRAVLMAVDEGSLGWGREATAHELAHVVIGAYTFSCLDSTPTWLSEGLAMNAEGRPEPYAAGVLAAAMEEDSLLSVRALGGMFSSDSDLAVLAYAQSESLTAFLNETYGPERMLALLDEFRSGSSPDRALREVYGFDRDGLEAAWREWAGAPPMAREVEGEATRTPYPTLAPITGPSTSYTATPPSASTSQPSAPSPPSAPWLTIALAAGCAISSLLVLAIVALVLRRK